MTTNVLEQPGEPCLVVCHGRDVGSTYNRMLVRICQSSRCDWMLLRIYDPYSMLLIERLQKIFCKVPFRSMLFLLRVYRLGLKITFLRGFRFFHFPLEHRKTIRTTNSLERINKEIRRRTRVVGVFPNEASCLRLVLSLLMEISEEWQIGKRYCAGKSLNC